jgi:hypothetical protein
MKNYINYILITTSILLSNYTSAIEINVPINPDIVKVVEICENGLAYVVAVSISNTSNKTISLVQVFEDGLYAPKPKKCKIKKPQLDNKKTSKHKDSLK